jgi:hypothetical protein
MRNLFFTGLALSLMILLGCDRNNHKKVDEPEGPSAPEFNPELEAPDDQSQGDGASVSSPASPPPVEDEGLGLEKSEEVVVSDEEIVVSRVDERQGAISELVKIFPHLNLDDASELDVELSSLLLAGIQIDKDVGTLINAQSDISRPVDDYGRTALAYAASFSRKPEMIIPAILKAGADVNAIDKGGMTPLMYAAWESPNPAETLKVLIEHGANIDQVNSVGGTAREFLEFNPFISDEAVALLGPVEAVPSPSEGEPLVRKPEAAGFQHNGPLLAP